MDFTIISFFVIITFIHSIFFLRWKRNGILISLLLLSTVTEITRTFSKQYIFVLIYTYFIIIFWLKFLFLVFNKKIFLPIAIPFSFFCFTMIFVADNLLNAAFYMFTVGSIIYITSFIVLSFNVLKIENFNLFLSNEFLLIISPIFFFIGLSFLFAFGSKSLFKEKIFGNIYLYNLINYSVNLIYYSLINLYIYKEYKRNHV